MGKLIWTKKKLKEGFDKYIEEHGHLPTTHEVDQVAYLPTSRQIQKRLGGLQKLRKELGYSDTHFGKGKHRSKIANMSNHRGRNSERLLEAFLKDKFGEVFVHTEKMYGTSKSRVDFYVYTPDGNFGVDVFYPDHLRTMQSNVNIKMHKYIDFSEPLFFVVANKEITQSELDQYSSKRIVAFPENVTLATLDTFKDKIQNFRVFSSPIVK